MVMKSSEHSHAGNTMEVVGTLHFTNLPGIAQGHLVLRLGWRYAAPRLDCECPGRPVARLGATGLRPSLAPCETGSPAASSCAAARTSSSSSSAAGYRPTEATRAVGGTPVERSGPRRDPQVAARPGPAVSPFACASASPAGTAPGSHG